MFFGIKFEWANIKGTAEVCKHLYTYFSTWLAVPDSIENVEFWLVKVSIYKCYFTYLCYKLQNKQK